MDLPDSSLARAAARLVRTASPPALAHHALRSYWWAVALAEVDGVRYDPELLFVAAALHDLGLEPEFDSGRPFEIDGGRAAAELVRKHGGTDESARTVEQAIVLHMAREIVLADGAETYLLWESTGTDVAGSRLAELPAGWVDRVTAALPRLDFTDVFAGRVADQAARKPQSRAASLWDAGLLERMASYAWDADHGLAS